VTPDSDDRAGRRDFQPPAEAAGNNSPKSPRRILVVDDNRDAAVTMAMLLRLTGHQTSVAHSGQNALAMLDDVQPDVVLLDIGLPEMDGYELARRIRAVRGDVFLIAVSGYGQAEDRARSRAAGFSQHFVKPVDTEMLLAFIGQLG
jgi:CheY-like chemotaxis protein